MAHQLTNVPLAPCNDEVPTPLLEDQVLETLFEVVPHMPTESQISFLAMFGGNTSSPPSQEAFTKHTPPPRPVLTLGVLRSVVQAKTAQHLCESDSAFEAKQLATGKTLKKSGGSRGVNKRYEKPQRNKPKAVASSENIHTTPYGVLWSSGGTPASGNLQATGASADTATYFYSWDSKDPSSSIRRYSPA